MEYIFILFIILLSFTRAQNLTSCENGGTIQIQSSGSQICLCTTNFTGDNCQVATNGKSCLNGGTIMADSSGNISCECGTNYTGIFCESVVCTHCSDDIYKAIFRNYVPNNRPALYPDNLTEVSVYFTLVNLLDIIEKNEQMKVMGFFGLTWLDDRLAWNPNDYGGFGSITIPAQDVWLPDVILSNTGTSFYEYSYKRDFLVSILYTGSILWEFGGIILTNCNIDMNRYPFDQQNCSIDIETWRYTKHQIKLVLNSVNLRSSVFGNSLWNLTDYQGKEYLKYGNLYSGVTFWFNWKRMPLYYYMNIIVPAIMMVLVCLGVFWLPSDSGEKVSLAVTVLLAFSVFLIIIMDNTPTGSSSVPLLTTFVILVMAVTTMSLLVSIFIAHLNSKKNTYPVPNWLRKFCFKYLARIMCMKSSVPKYRDASIKIEQAPSINENGSSVDIKSEPIKLDTDGVKWRLDQILKFIGDQEESDEIEQQWIAIGRVIDRLFFWMSFILLVVLFILMFLNII